MISPVNWQPLAQLLLTGAALAALPVTVWVWRQRGRTRSQRLSALIALILFLTFDLVVFGAFTRLTDSGLGCPDWPGCYGHASPVGAQDQIAMAQAAQPTGPVTWGKAWIEMVHRYLATGVGALITVLVVLSWCWRGASDHTGDRRAETVSPWWPTVTLAWVMLQGAFGAWTVTLKLYPAVVTGHLLGGMGLLMLLAAQRAWRMPAWPVSVSGLSSGSGAVRWWLRALAVVVVCQVALGAWVSTNDAVLACPDFPTCQGHWWPVDANFAQGFELLRPRGLDGDGRFLSLGALVAIHWGHRLMALLVLVVAGITAGALWRMQTAAARRAAKFLLGLMGWQVLTGVSMVVWGWPLLAALGHTAGAAVWVIVLTHALVWTRSSMSAFSVPFPVPTPMGGSPDWRSAHVAAGERHGLQCPGDPIHPVG